MEKIQNKIIKLASESGDNLDNEERDIFIGIVEKIDFESINNYDEFKDDLLTRIGEETYFHYYGSAMEFLKKNDPSLSVSLELAESLGYTSSNLESTTLASILKKSYVTDFYLIIQDKVESFF